VTLQAIAVRGVADLEQAFVISGNPEQQGVVTSIARPGGNLTGFSYMSSDLAAKRLALLCEIS
jgi:putative ABC transport system substrate-binding protein